MNIFVRGILLLVLTGVLTISGIVLVLAPIVGVAEIFKIFDMIPWPLCFVVMVLAWKSAEFSWKRIEIVASEFPDVDI